MGLLDALSDPQNALAIGLLGAASSGKGFGGGLLDAVNYANAVQQHNEDRSIQKRYRDAQIQELQRKSLADARLQDYAQAWLGGRGIGAGGSSSQASQPGAAVNPGGLGLVPPAGFTPNASGVSGAPQSGLKQFTQSHGIPDQLIGLDLLFNGGKGIPGIVEKATTANWQNVNGNLVNTNAPGFQGGFQPGMSISANGQATAWQPDGQGGLVVGAPRGALETFRAYQGAAADSKPIKVYNPATGREEYTSEGNVVRGARSVGNVSSPGYAGGSRDAAAQEQVRMMQNELMRLPVSHPDVPFIKREIERLQGPASAGAQSGNYAAGPSAAESIANEAARVKAVKQTEADITPTAQKISSVDTARDALSVIDQALNHPGLKTATGLSGSLDPRNYIAGTDATNFRVLVDQIKGGVFLDAYKDLRGAGQITEVEGQKAEAAKARINRAQSPDEFVKGLQEYRAIVDRGYERARRNLPAGSSGATGSWDEPAAGQQAAAPRATMRYNPQSGRLEKVN